MVGQAPPYNRLAPTLLLVVALAMLAVAVEAQGDCDETLGRGPYCTVCGPCAAGEGDCDRDSECAPGLICAADRGAEFGFGPRIDVCLPAEGGAGCDEPLGRGRYCTVCGPCVEGEGDCDRDSECAPGLSCAADRGAEFGFGPRIDVCLPADDASGGTGGDAGGGGPPSSATCGGVPALSAAEVRALLEGAATQVSGPLTAAVVDRAGRPLGLYRRGASPARDDLAVGLARTAAFFSNDQAPLSSRTVRFVSGIHFPPGIPNTPNAALYGIENTNRGCELNVTFNPGKDVPRPLSVAGGPCRAGTTTGCGTGPVTGKFADPFAPRDAELRHLDENRVDPGGIPIYRGATLLGGIGVTGPSPAAAEGAAVSAVLGMAGLSPLPALPLPPEGIVVFIDGVALPFARNLVPPAGSGPGNPAAGSIVDGPRAGGCAPEGFLVGPRAGRFLSRTEVERIVMQARQVAARTRAVIRLPAGRRSRMVIAVGDVDGEILALFRMADATVFSVDVAAAKARNVVYFSDPAAGGPADLPGVPAGTAISNRTISFGAQPFFPPGIARDPGPFFDLYRADARNPCSQGSQPAGRNQNGVVFFPGSIPLYRGAQLIGGLGISGDGVEQDDYVSFFGAQGFQPPETIWADRVIVRGVRLPFLKFPRNPER